MKNFLWPLAGLLLISPVPLLAQAPPAPVTTAAVNLPALEATPPILGSDGSVTLRFAGVLPSKVRVALYEAGRDARLADVSRSFTIQGGAAQTTVRLDAEPGTYEFRLLATNKAATPLSAPSSRVRVPGLVREPGAWLPNGSPFIALPEAGASPSPSLPLFLPGLARDFGKKARPPQTRTPLPGGQALPWRTLALPPLREMTAPGYDFAALRGTLTQRLQEAQTRGERGFYAWSLPAGTGETPLSGAANAVLQLRPLLTQIAPGAALLLEVDARQNPAQAARDVDAVAALCDAVLLRVPANASALWPMKVARRVAEEQPFFDLPILLQIEGEARPAIALDYLMAGATGLVLDGAQSAMLAELTAKWQRDTALWTGAVTLEDAGMLAPPDYAGALDDETLLALYKRLRGVGRVPLLARLGPGIAANASPETFMLRLGDRISAATIDRLEKAARAGAKIYLEGAPQLDETGKAVPWRLGTLVGAQITAMPARQNTLLLEDPWFFGTLRGTRLTVTQSFALTLNPPTMSAQAKTRKGEFAQVAPFAVAKLADGTPGIVVNPLGKGEVVWMPHRLHSGPALSFTPLNSSPQSASVSAPPPALNPITDTELSVFYAAIADYVSSRLVQLRNADGQGSAPFGVRVALRRSPKGAFLMAFFNDNNRPVSLSVTAEGASQIALDLSDESALPTTVRGNQATFSLTLPANGWKWLTLAETAQALSDERNAPRAKAKLR